MHAIHTLGRSFLLSLLLTGTISADQINNQRDNSPLSKALAEKDHGRAYLLAKQRAEAGNAEAQFHLGLMYRDGLGAKKRSLPDAGKWLKRSADQGHPAAMYDLALLLEDFAPKDKVFVCDGKRVSGQEWAMRLGDSQGGKRKCTMEASDPRWNNIGTANDATLWIQRSAMRGHPRALHDICGIADVKRAPPSLREESLALCRNGIERLATDRADDKLELMRLMNSAKMIFKDAGSADRGLTRKPPAVSAECSNNQNRGDATVKSLTRCCDEKLRADDVDGAIADCSAALNINSKDKRAYGTRAVAWARKGKYENALADSTHAIVLNPKDVISYISRANIKSQAGDYNGAIADINLAIQIQPKEVILYIRRANIKSQTGDYNGAIADINLAIQIKPDDDLLYEVRGLIRSTAGDLDMAVRDFDRALHIKPTSARTLYSRGIAYYLKGEYQLAVADIDSSNILEPDKQGYKSVRLYLATSRNGGDGMNELVENAKNIDPESWPAQIVSLFLGRTTPRELIDKSRDPNPYKQRDKVCVTNYYVSQWYLLRGEKTQAAHFLRETTRHCPKATIQYMGAVSDLKRYGTKN